MYLEALQENQGGFNFDLSLRNTNLIQKKIVHPHQFKKTGTTIVGCIFKDGVILAADTRSTAGEVVADKNCEKLHYLAPNMRCAGAGTAADNEWVTKKMEKDLELKRLNTGRQSRVAYAVQRFTADLFRYQGHIGAYLIVGGVDINGPQLVSIQANGAASWEPFTSLGSGSLNAISILEAKFRDGLSEKEAIDICTEAIEAGIIYDLGSGSNVDVCVIRKEKVSYLRNHKTIHSKRQNKPFNYSFPTNNTPLVREIKFTLEPADKQEKDKMQIE